MIAIMSSGIVQLFQQHPERTVALARGEWLFHRGDPVKSMYLLTRGGVDLVRYQRDGAALTLHRAQAGTVLAEASLHAKRYHCGALCVDPATMLAIAKGGFARRLREDAGLAAQWSAYLARGLQGARVRSELLTRKTVAERLAGWLEMNDAALPPKGQWKNVAAEIGVTPEALYRELAKQKR